MLNISRLCKNFIIIHGFLLFFVVPLLIFAQSNLIQNDSFETFTKYDEYQNSGKIWDLQVAEHWERFLVEAEEPNRIRYFTSCDWNRFNKGPAGFCEKRDQAEAQVIWTSSSNPFDAGMYQQVTGLTIEQAYGFQVATLQVFESTTDRQDGKMKRKLGLDPFGGTDPESENVIWSPIDTIDTIWFAGSIGAKAMSTTMTVFIRFESSGDQKVSFSSTQIWIDDAYLDVAPLTTLELAQNQLSDDAFEVTATWQGDPLDGFTPYAYEAQYCELPEGQTSCDDSGWNSPWQTLQVFGATQDPPTGTAATFTAATDKNYLVRARTWHNLSDQTHQMAGPWTVASVNQTVLSKIQGQVIDNQGRAFAEAEVQLAQTGAITQSEKDGTFSFQVDPGIYTLTTKAAGWQIISPIQVDVTETTLATVTLTLQPEDNIVADGGFDDDSLNNWSTTFTPTFTIKGGFQGQSLRLSSNGVMSLTRLVTDVQKPTLTFWYNIQNGDGVSYLKAEIIGRDSLSPTLPLVFTHSTAGWQQGILSLDFTESGTGNLGLLNIPPTTYSGPLTIRFSINISGPQTQPVIVPVFLLDEVIAGSSQEEVVIRNVFLPVILTQSPTPVVNQCPTTSSRSYETVPPENPFTTPDHPDHRPDYLHGDLNLALRSYLTVTEQLSLITYNETPDSNSPHLHGLLNRLPAFTSAYQVYDWDWGCTKDGAAHGCRGELLSSAVNPNIQWSVTLLGLQTTSGEEVSIPTRGPEIFSGDFKALVLYAEEKRITLVYLREDSLAFGYGIHLEGVCVDPNLLSLYQAQVTSEGYRKAGYALPALKSGDILGTALGEEIKVAVRDNGLFMDPRSRRDWWPGQ